MKKFFSNLSNKNKLMVWKRRENIILILMFLIATMVFEYMAYVISCDMIYALLTYLMVGAAGLVVADNLEKKHINELRKNYSKELSNKYYLNNKDTIDVEKQLKCINILSRVRSWVRLVDMISSIILGFPTIYFMLENASVGISMFGIMIGKTILLSNIIDKIDFRNETIIRVIEMKKSDVMDVKAVDEKDMNDIISKRTNCLSDDSYVPRPSQGMKVSRVALREATDIWNEYLDYNDGEQKTRRGPVRARRINNQK